jgi:hypothetical protein
MSTVVRFAGLGTFAGVTGAFADPDPDPDPAGVAGC